MAVYGSALKAIYGRSEAEVRLDLVPVWLDWPKGDGKSAQSVVVWCNKHVMAARLRNVNTEVKAWCKATGRGYTIHPPVGCFNWRTIRGSLAQSMHSGAIAIDINPAENPMVYGPVITNIPPEIIAIFERNGFLWGGRWTRRDAMHFELDIHTEPAVLPETPTVPTRPPSLKVATVLGRCVLRNGASIVAKRVHGLLKGEKVIVLGINGSGDGKWRKIQTVDGGYIGWVGMKMLPK
jgi:hypothetical protein